MIAEEINVTTVLDKIQEYNRNWLQHVNRTHRDITENTKQLDQEAEESGETIKQTSKRMIPILKCDIHVVCRLECRNKYVGPS